MMRHFVGNAYLYHVPPAEAETRVEVPVLVNPSGASDYLMINVDREDLTPVGRKRYDALPGESGIPEEILKEHGGIGTELLKELMERVRAALVSNSRGLVWTSFPDRDQRLAVAELLLFVAHKRRETTGLHTPKQVAWAWTQLLYHQSLPDFLGWYATTFGSEEAPVDSAFQFLQACEFSFVRSLGTIEAIVKHLKPGAAISYGAYMMALENWFRPPWIKQLDETGIPMPLAERLQKYLKSPASRSDALLQIRSLGDTIPNLDVVDRYILKQQGLI